MKCLNCVFELQEENCVFELTYNWGVDEPYDKGNAYAQVSPLGPCFGFSASMHVLPLRLLLTHYSPEPAAH